MKFFLEQEQRITDSIAAIF